MKKFTIVLVVFLSLITLSCKSDKSVITIVSTEEVETIMQSEDVQLIDVRTPEEYEEGHILNAQNIDYNSPNFEVNITKLNKSKPVLLYCKSGNRSGKSSQIFLEAGFKTIYDLEGGITEWIDKGLEVNIN